MATGSSSSGAPRPGFSFSGPSTGGGVAGESECSGGVSSVWLEAYEDPLAGLKAYSQHLCVADLNGDGDGKLIIADLDRKLRVYKGASLVSTNALLSVPVAVAAFYMDYNTPRRPSIAVAAGSSIFVYRNLRAYNKFILPPVEASEAETLVALCHSPVPVLLSTPI